MQLVFDIPDELAKDFVAQIPEAERNRAAADFIAQMIANHTTQTERERKRQALLDNLSPFVKKYAGSISEADLRALNDDRINYLLDK